MTGTQVRQQNIEQHVERLGAAWIEAITEKDFPRIATLCQPAVRSRLMTPRRFDMFEDVDGLIGKVKGWFETCSGFQTEQTRIAMVGEKLAIFYRLSFQEEGQPYEAEQQLYCALRDGLIDQVSLVCSGFQPVREPAGAAADPPPGIPPSFAADARLQVDAASSSGSTCAILTPAIKRKLGEMGSGQVLEVQVDDPSAKEDIEAWCRLSGNTLLRMDAGAGRELRFYLMKK